MTDAAFVLPEPPEVPGRWRSDPFLLAYAVLAPLYLAPLVVTRLLPSFDLPHHLAIADALLKSAAPDSPYARDFVVGLRPAPFILHFLVLTTLGRVMTLALAARLLVGALVLALPLATARLLTACGRPRFVAVLAFPLVCAMPLHFGFVAFVTALPFLIWTIALAADDRAWHTSPQRTALLLGATSSLLWFSHLEAWAVGVAAACGAIAVGRRASATRIAGLAALAPSVALSAWYLIANRVERHASGAPSFIEALVRARIEDLREHSVLTDLVGRLSVLPVHLLRGFVDGTDLVTSRLLWALVLAGLLITAFTPRRLRRAYVSRAALASAAVVLLAYLGLPHHALPDAYSVYPRFAVVLLIALLPLLPDVRPWRPLILNGLALGLMAILAAHALNLRYEYSAFAAEVRDFESLVASAPPNLAAGGLVFDAESAVMDVGGIFTGVPAYVVAVRRDARSSTWLYYCGFPQMPCRMRDAGAAPLPEPNRPEQFNAQRGLDALQLLYVRGGPSASQIFGARQPRARLLAQQGRWRLFERVTPGPPPTPVYFPR